MSWETLAYPYSSESLMRGVVRSTRKLTTGIDTLPPRQHTRPPISIQPPQSTLRLHLSVECHGNLIDAQIGTWTASESDNNTSSARDDNNERKDRLTLLC